MCQYCYTVCATHPVKRTARLQLFITPINTMQPQLYHRWIYTCHQQLPVQSDTNADKPPHRRPPSATPSPLTPAQLTGLHTPPSATKVGRITDMSTSDIVLKLLLHTAMQTCALKPHPGAAQGLLTTLRTAGNHRATQHGRPHIHAKVPHQLSTNRPSARAQLGKQGLIIHDALCQADGPSTTPPMCTCCSMHLFTSVCNIRLQAPHYQAQIQVTKALYQATHHSKAVGTLIVLLKQDSQSCQLCNCATQAGTESQK